MTFQELLDRGFTPPADDLHDSLTAPPAGEPRDVIRGSFPTTGRAAGYERSAR